MSSSLQNLSPKKTSKKSSKSSRSKSKETSSDVSIAVLRDDLVGRYGDTNVDSQSSAPVLLKKKKKTKKMNVEDLISSDRKDDSTVEYSAPRRTEKTPKELSSTLTDTPKRISKKKKEVLLDDNDVVPTRHSETKRQDSARKIPDDDDNDYDDDFENYEDDFETSDHDPSPRPIPPPPSTPEPQEAVRKSSARRNEDRPAADVKHHHRRTRDNFDNTTQSVGITMSQNRGGSARCKKILSMVKLEHGKIDNFEIHSQPPWEFYIQSVGAGGSKKQTFVQTNFDSVDVEVQTDAIETRHVFCDGPYSGQYSTTTQDIDFSKLSDLTSIVEVAIEENNEYGIAVENESKVADDKSLFVKTFQIPSTALEQLSDRVIVDLNFSVENPNRLLVAYGPPHSNSREKMQSCLVLWDLKRGKPIYLMECPSIITHCQCSPSHHSVFVAGTEEGTLYLWDCKTTAPHVCSPSFSTASLPEYYHMGMIKSLLALPTGLGFQCISLDESGEVHFWNVVEDIETPQMETNHDASNFKMSHSGSVRNMEKDTEANLVRMQPSDANQILIANTRANIEHQTRQGTFATPKMYSPKKPLEMNYALIDMGSIGIQVLDIDFNPVAEDFFAVAYSSGVFSIFHTSRSMPLRTYYASNEGNEEFGFGFAPIEQVRWSTSNPAVLYVYDAMNMLYIWDFRESTSSPVAKIPMIPSRSKQLVKPVLSVSVGAPTFLAVLDDAYTVQVHQIKQDSSRRHPTYEELEALFFSIA